MTDNESMLTTIDNPFNPFEEWDEWYSYDKTMGYNTTEYLARIVRSAPDLSDADQELSITQAIDEIVEYNILGVYKKVFRDDFSTSQTK